jgi:hypothetical protein
MELAVVYYRTADQNVFDRPLGRALYHFLAAAELDKAAEKAHADFIRKLRSAGVKPVPPPETFADDPFRER